MRRLHSEANADMTEKLVVEEMREDGSSVTVIRVDGRHRGREQWRTSMRPTNRGTGE